MSPVPTRKRTVEITAAGLVLVLAVMLWLALRSPATPGAVAGHPLVPPTAAPTGLISADTAVAQAIKSLSAGGPYTRLDGAPTEIRAQLDPTGQPRWMVVLRGRIIVITPAAAGGSVPEREEIYHQMLLVLDAQTGEVISSEAFPPDAEMDASAYPLRPLPNEPAASAPAQPTFSTAIPLPTLGPAPVP